MRVLFCVVVVLMAACSVPPVGPSVVDVDRLLATRRAKLRAAQEEFAARTQLPRQHASDAGTLIVTRTELGGPLDGEFLRLRFTYVNTTELTLDRIHIRVWIQDVHGAPLGEERVALVMPLDYRFVPRCSYTDEIAVPTGGAHWAAGWTYRVELRGEQL